MVLFAIGENIVFAIGENIVFAIGENIVCLCNRFPPPLAFGFEKGRGVPQAG
jgi:hypothetical protein